MDAKKIFYRVLPKRPTECAFYLNKSICSDKSLVDKMRDFLGKVYGVKESDDVKIVEQLGKKLNCDKESCILAKKEFKEYAGDQLVKNNLKNFKPEGPAKTFDLLSNFNIDDVMSQWDQKFGGNFLHIEFQMRDFEKVRTRLATINLAREIRSGKKTFGVVLNTDYSVGPGIHWFCLFGDFRDPKQYTLEFFNSSGNLPLPEVQAWLHKTKAVLEKETNVDTKIIIVTRMEHQKDEHSCGPYSLFYIWCRLHGIPYQFFGNNRIPDELMHEYRKHLFRHY